MTTLKRILLAAAVAVPLSLGACGNSGPSGVVEEFTTNVARGNVDAALPLLSSQVRGLMGEQKLRLALSQGADQARENGGFKGINIISEAISEDKMTAVVSAESVFGNGEKEASEFNLVRENDAWRITMDAGDK